MLLVVFLINLSKGGVIKMKIVIMGRSSSGKTSVINNLKERGYNIVEECARRIIEANPNEDVLERQKKIFREQIKLESELLESKIYFIERGLVDGVGFTLFYCGSLFEEQKKMDLRGRYDLVFMLEGLDFINDGLRVEKDENEAQQVHEAVVGTYRIYGYSLIKVPALSIEKRVDFILNYLEKIK